MDIEDEDDNNLIKKLLVIGAHWSWILMSSIFLCFSVICLDDDDNNLFKMFLTIGVHWSWRLKIKIIII